MCCLQSTLRTKTGCLTRRAASQKKKKFSQGSDVQLKVRNKKGNPVLDIKSIPMSEVGTLPLALMEHVPPGSGQRRPE
jgi:hypothetical protein